MSLPPIGFTFHTCYNAYNPNLAYGVSLKDYLNSLSYDTAKGRVPSEEIRERYTTRWSRLDMLLRTRKYSQ